MKSSEFITARSSRRLVVRSFFVPRLLPAMLCTPGCRTFQSKEAIPAHQTVKFLMIGFGPYTPQEEIDLGQYVDQANAQGEQRDAFQIIKRGRVSQTRVVDPFQLPPYGNK